MKVTLDGIKAKIKGETYLVLPNGRTTVCQLTLENGFTVEGYSACVDPNEFDLNLGRKYAFEDAIGKIWVLEGYLLAEKMYWDRAQPVATNPRRITLHPQQIQAMKDNGVWNVKEKRDKVIATMVKANKKPHWTQTPEGKKKMAARKRSKK